jgi:hypothetical protein
LPTVKLFGAAVATLAFGTSAGGAWAQTAISGGSPGSLSLALTVRASVATTCGFTPGAIPQGSVAAGDLTKTYSQDVLFSLRCNTPSRVGIVSDNGGLLASIAGTPAPGYAKVAPYKVELKLVGDGGVSVSGICTADKLVAAATGCAFRGASSSVTGLLLNVMATDASGSYLRIGNAGLGPAGILLASTTYADRLTVTVSPAS